MELLYAAATESQNRDTTVSWKPLSQAPLSQGTGGGSTMSLRVWKGCHRGEDLAIGIACDRPTPWNRRPEHTHTPLAQLRLGRVVRLTL